MASCCLAKTAAGPRDVRPFAFPCQQADGVPRVLRWPPAIRQYLRRGNRWESLIGTLKRAAVHITDQATHRGPRTRPLWLTGQ